MENVEELKYSIFVGDVHEELDIIAAVFVSIDVEELHYVEVAVPKLLQNVRANNLRDSRFRYVELDVQGNDGWVILGVNAKDGLLYAVLDYPHSPQQQMASKFLHLVRNIDDVLIGYWALQVD